MANFSWMKLLTRAVYTMSARAEKVADPQTYVDQASAAIDRLNNDWYSAKTGLWDNAWWNSANALTTLADFSTLRLEEGNKLNIGGIMRTTYINAQKTHVQTFKTMDAGRVTSKYCLDWSEGCMTKRDFIEKRGFDDFINEFYDDEGWWALALIRSHDATGDEDYLQSAIEIFNDMQTGLGGPCGGGIYWSKETKYVNAIANELYLSIAASLARRVPQNETYLQIAKSQWEWFDNSGMINAQGLINDGLNDKCENNGLQTWTYNQGVILGGLAELGIVTGDRSYVNKAVRIAKAAIEHLANDDGILVETDECELKSGNCGTDGQQFKGIFMRNLRYLWEVAPEEEFKEFILKNARSIWENDRSSYDQLGIAWTGPYVKATGPTQSSALDVLVAAIAVADG